MKKFLTILFFFIVILQLQASQKLEAEFERMNGIPAIRWISDLAQKHGLDSSIGIFAGTARDVFLGVKMTGISDIDLFYDSREPGYKAFRNELISYAPLKERLPIVRDNLHMFSVNGVTYDLNVDNNPGFFDKSKITRGLTMNLMGIAFDGTVFDPTGKALEDLTEKKMRFMEGYKKGMSFGHLALTLKYIARYRDFEIVRETKAQMKEVLETILENKESVEKYTQAAIEIKETEDLTAEWEKERVKKYLSKKYAKLFNFPVEEYGNLVEMFFQLKKAGKQTSHENVQYALEISGTEEFLKKIDLAGFLK